jgi:PadR family transcriptional regulator PadR
MFYIVPYVFLIYVCPMNLENTKAQMRKGVLEFCILSVLSARDAYTNEIIAQLKAARLIVVEGTLYPLLTRLKNAGLLQYRWEESTSGPPRKYYSLTETGHSFLNELKLTWEELVSAVSNTQLQNTEPSSHE